MFNEDGCPIPNPNPDFSELIALTNRCLAHSVKEQYQDEDDSHYIYEEAMMAIYGKDYFDWRNEQGW